MEGEILALVSDCRLIAVHIQLSDKFKIMDWSGESILSMSSHYFRLTEAI